MNNEFDVLFDSFFDRLFQRVNHVNPTNFPPHNLVKIGDNEMVLSLAVAGYAEDNIDISVEDRTLKITGELSNLKMRKNKIKGKNKSKKSNK